MQPPAASHLFELGWKVVRYKTRRQSVPTIEGFPDTGVGAWSSTMSGPNFLAGLIETLAAPPYNGRAHLSVLASSLQLEAEEIFHLGESLQLLGFAQFQSEGDLMLTNVPECASPTLKPMPARGCLPNT